jgi:hypothetical protein
MSSVIDFSDATDCPGDEGKESLLENPKIVHQCGH